MSVIKLSSCIHNKTRDEKIFTTSLSVRRQYNMDPSLLYTYYQNLLKLIMVAHGLVMPEWPENAQVQDGDRFDFIVVGAGSAGSVVASRLTEVPDCSVLLIEAGGDPNAAVEIPGLLGLLPQSDLDWCYYTEDDGYSSQAQNNTGKIPYVRGKTLGGSSSLNTMVYARGNILDYDGWEEAGFEGWNWTTALRYFKKSENMESDIIMNDPTYSNYHNTGGPITIVQQKRTSVLEEQKLEKILELFNEIGIDTILDYNALTQQGIAKPFGFYSSAPAERSSTAKGYLAPARNRTNLSVLKNAYATKIVINHNNANGVKVLMNNKTYTYYAKKEVIVSTGSINTPKLLIASGVGPNDVLERLNIDIVNDLPVGKEMQDHFYIPLAFSGANDTITVETTKAIPAELNAIPIPLLNGYLSFDNNTQPDIQLLPYYFGVASEVNEANCVSTLGYKRDICEPWLKINEDHEMIIINIVPLHPKSKGRVEITSVEPDVAPKIYTGYLSDDEDLTLMLKAIRRVFNITETKYLKNYLSEFIKLSLPECDVLEFDSDEYWKCYVPNTVTTVYHSAGTCAMGKVVDKSLKVYGVDKLRIVDASVLPTMPSGNINAPVIMVAEHISDVIKQEYSART